MHGPIATPSPACPMPGSDLNSGDFTQRAVTTSRCQGHKVVCTAALAWAPRGQHGCVRWLAVKVFLRHWPEGA